MKKEWWKDDVSDVQENMFPRLTIERVTELCKRIKQSIKATKDLADQVYRDTVDAEKTKEELLGEYISTLRISTPEVNLLFKNLGTKLDISAILSAARKCQEEICADVYNLKRYGS